MSKRKLYFGLLVLSSLFFLNTVGMWHQGQFRIQSVFAVCNCIGFSNCTDIGSDPFNACSDGSSAVPVYCTPTNQQLANNNYCGSPTDLAPKPAPLISGILQV
jgi:hypothetical protein